jgi:hypothetical protein
MCIKTDQENTPGNSRHGSDIRKQLDKENRLSG